jgi:Fe-S cluster assembly protein SufD
MAGITESIAELSATLPGPGKLSEQRALALAAFRAHGLPSVSSEDWRYTDISSLDNAALGFVPPRNSIEPRIDLLPIDADRVVFVNGQLCDSLTRIESSGMQWISVLGADWSPLASGFPLNSDVLEHPLGQLNTATAQHGVLIRTQPRTERPRTVNIVLMHSGNAALALQPRIVLDLAERSSLSVVLHCVSDSAAAGWMNSVIEIRQAPESRLELVQLQEHGDLQTHTLLVSGALDRSAFASIACFDLGAKLARNDIDIRLNGPGSEAEIFGVFLPMQSQHIDTHVCVDHAAAHTTSTAEFRGIAGPASRGVFNGKVIVRPDAQKISAEQRSDNLLLCADAEIDTKPELEIYADDVKCSHGATVGNLDEQHLFYLRSRGIDDTAARALLTYAFAQSVVEKLSNESLRDVVAARIAQRLPEHEHWERLT